MDYYPDIMNYNPEVLELCLNYNSNRLQGMKQLERIVFKVHKIKHATEKTKSVQESHCPSSICDM